MSDERLQKRIISIDEGLVKSQLGEVVRETVEETLNKMLDAEADELCGAKRYEPSVERLDTRAGHYERSLETKAGKVKLKVPKLRTIPFESAIIDRYRRRECSVEEALMEMHLAGVSVRRVEDITEALWGDAGVSWCRLQAQSGTLRQNRYVAHQTASRDVSGICQYSCRDL